MPERFVDTQFIIEIWTGGGLNESLTNNYTSFRIMNSMDTCWPVFQLYFNMDSKVVIDGDIYGQEDIDVKVWWTGEDGEPVEEPLTFNLLYLQANIVLPPMAQDNKAAEKDSQRRQIVFEFLAKPAFLVMTQFVNKLYEEETGLTPLAIVKDIVKETGISQDYIIDKGFNDNLVPQCLIPPMTIKSSIDLVNDKFGIFEGPLFRYANYAGQLLMWDLKQKFEEQKDSGFTKHHKMPSEAVDEDLFEDVNEMISENPDQFMTYDEAVGLHNANAHVIKYGYDNIQIIHPHQDIAYLQHRAVPDIIEEYGLWHSSKDPKMNPQLQHRKMYYTDCAGFETGTGYSGEYSDANLTSKMGHDVKAYSTVRFSIFRNIKVSYCQKVGEILFLQPYMDHEMTPGSNYAGPYLLTHSDIIFTKVFDGSQRDNIDCIATLTGVRTVQTKDDR